MATGAPQPSPPPLPRRPSRHRGAVRAVIAAAVLGAAAVLLATPVARRLQRQAAVERALGRGLQEGMQLTEATELLKRLGVEFAVDPAAGGAAIVRFGREVARDGATVTEQQLVFDAQHRLVGMRTVAQVRGR